MGALLAWVAGSIVRAISVVAGGWRTWIGAVLVKVILVVVLYNVLSAFFGEIIEWSVGKLGGVNGPDAVVSSFDVGSLSTLGAWFCTTMQIPECVAFMMSCVILKWSMRKIPFVRW